MNTDTWRFFVNTHDAAPDSGVVPTIYRARPVKQADDSGDTWRNYWDGDSMVAIVGDYWYGSYQVSAVTSNPESIRVLDSLRACRQHGGDEDHALTVLARRITGNWDACFVYADTYHKENFFALSWAGDPDGVWAEEIESVYHGDVWRLEVEEYQPGSGMGGSDWVTADDSEGDLYGEHMAEAAWFDNFPLDEFPADLTIQQNGE